MIYIFLNDQERNSQLKRCIYTKRKFALQTVSKNATIPKILSSRFRDHAANLSLTSPWIEPLCQISYKVSTDISVIESHYI
jgi:hypothetical protein